MKSKLLFIILLLSLVSSVKGEDLYYLPSKGITPLKPLTSFKELVVSITDTVNFKYQVQSVDAEFSGKIWAVLPLFERKGEHVNQVQDGFNVGFMGLKWLVVFLRHEGFKLVYQERNIYRFEKIAQSEIALK